MVPAMPKVTTMASSNVSFIDVRTNAIETSSEVDPLFGVVLRLVMEALVAVTRGATTTTAEVLHIKFTK